MALFDKLFSLKRRLDAEYCDIRDRSRYVRQMIFIHYFYFWVVWHVRGWRTEWALVSEAGSLTGHWVNLRRSVDARESVRLAAARRACDDCARRGPRAWAVVASLSQRGAGRVQCLLIIYSRPELVTDTSTPAHSTQTGRPIAVTRLSMCI